MKPIELCPLFHANLHQQAYKQSKQMNIRGWVKKYPHWCFNVLWVRGTAFCARMLTDSTFVTACGKFQHYHTV